MSTPPSEKKSAPDNKWWEFYFVRYFVGTVVGGAILLYLNSANNSSLKNLILPGVTDASGLDAQKLALLAAMGLAFCYVASAPVLVFHATRGVFLGHAPKTYRIAVWLALGITATSATVALYAFPNFGRKPIVVAALFAIVVLIQFILLTFSLLGHGNATHSYYLSLVHARSHDSEPARQYVESYKHLREHGNAFFILLFEVVLGIVLTAAPAPQVALIALLVWSVPAGFVWVIGTVLEYRFATTPPPP